MAEAKAQEAAKQDPKAGTGAGGEDLSMEEILHSIRKIIAEDDPDAKKPNGKAKADGAAPAGANVPGSDVLELTEMIKEDGTVESLKPAAPAGPTDILQSIDQVLEKKPEKPVEKAVEAPVAKPVEIPAEKPAAPVAAAPSKPSGDSLLSSEAASAAAASFQKLRTAESEPVQVATTSAPSFRSGVTVEDMVEKMLRPMMKEWLDNNLPQMVERIVEREVKKLTK